MLCSTMGRTLRLCSSLLLLLMLLFAELHFAVAADPPEIPPSPAPESGGTNPPSPISPSPDTGAPSPGPSSKAAPSPDNSPPAPPPSDLAPSPSPTPSPSPAPSVHSDINHDSKGTAQDETADSKGSGSVLKGGQKAGIALGVIFAACIVGVFGIIYKKRQDNVRRSRYGYAARRELL